MRCSRTLLCGLAWLAATGCSLANDDAPPGDDVPGDDAPCDRTPCVGAVLLGEDADFLGFSADGSSLAWQTRDGRVAVRDLRSGIDAVVAERPTRPWDVELATDGAAIAFLVEGDALVAGHPGDPLDRVGPLATPIWLGRAWALAPAGDQVLYWARDDGRSTLRAHRLRTRDDVAVITGGVTIVAAPQWAPSGRRVLFPLDGGDVVYDLDAARVHQWTRAPGATATHFVDDGALAYAEVVGGGLFVVRQRLDAGPGGDAVDRWRVGDRGDQIVLAPAHATVVAVDDQGVGERTVVVDLRDGARREVCSASACSVQLSPDESIAWVSGPTGGRLIDLASGAERVVTTVPGSVAWSPSGRYLTATLDFGQSYQPTEMFDVETGREVARAIPEGDAEWWGDDLLVAATSLANIYQYRANPNPEAAIVATYRGDRVAVSPVTGRGLVVDNALPEPGFFELGGASDVRTLLLRDGDRWLGLEAVAPDWAVVRTSDATGHGGLFAVPFAPR